MKKRRKSKTSRRKIAVPTLAKSDTQINKWLERGGGYIALEDKKTGRSLIEWRDEAMDEAVEDGFLNPRDLHGSAYDYAADMGILKRPQ